MTENQFRKLAVSLPETVESSHVGHPDFRIRNKVFASLRGAGEGTATVKLTADQQQAYLQSHPAVFSPAAGAWGRQGWTLIQLRPARSPEVKETLLLAWRNTAPKRMLDDLDQADE